MRRPMFAALIALALATTLLVPAAAALPSPPEPEAPPTDPCWNVPGCIDTAFEAVGWGIDTSFDLLSWSLDATFVALSCSLDALFTHCRDTTAVPAGADVYYVVVDSRGSGTSAWRETNGCDGLQTSTTTCSGSSTPPDHRVL